METMSTEPAPGQSISCKLYSKSIPVNKRTSEAPFQIPYTQPPGLHQSLWSYRKIAHAHSTAGQFNSTVTGACQRTPYVSPLLPSYPTSPQPQGVSVLLPGHGLSLPCELSVHQLPGLPRDSLERSVFSRNLQGHEERRNAICFYSC